MDLDNDHFSYADHRLPLARVVSECCVEQVAASLDALALELDQEAQQGNAVAQALSVASMVLRDRAVEVLNGDLDLHTAT